jgi:protein TonB
VAGRAGELAGWALSAAVHAALLGVVWRGPVSPPSRGEVVAVEIEEVERPRPPPPEERPPPPARPPAPAAPPPPNEPPPASAPAPRRAPIRVGVALSATAEGGGVAAPVGNTLYGKPPEVAPDPAEVSPFRAERYEPPTRVDRLPVPRACAVPPEEYPARARREGFEGDVRLRLLVDAEGRVREATVLSDPGRGLGPAAAEIARRHCRFEPALRQGQPVATEVPFTVRFVLP